MPVSSTFVSEPQQDNKGNVACAQRCPRDLYPFVIFLFFAYLCLCGVRLSRLHEGRLLLTNLESRSLLVYVTICILRKRCKCLRVCDRAPLSVRMLIFEHVHEFSRIQHSHLHTCSFAKQFYETSAKKNLNVDQAFTDIARDVMLRLQTQVKPHSADIVHTCIHSHIRMRLILDPLD
jgi:hypothetical protein